MKKPKFKLLKEFKTFVSKGSVLDLAVGMIIGSAFTAIITALVNGILKPLINWIPISETGDLITELRPAVIDVNTGAVLREALVLDWGAVISAIITFLLTALVLFAIIKAINTARDMGKKSAESIKKQLDKKDETAEEEAAPEIAVEEIPAVEPAPAKAASDATLELLKEIRDLLKSNKIEAATEKLEAVEE